MYHTQEILVWGEGYNRRIQMFGLVWFYGISTIVGYLMANLFVYIEKVLFKKIEFSMSTVFLFIQS